MQQNILLFFQRIGNGTLDKAASLITWMGQDVAAMAIIALVLWCINKRKGLVMGLILISANTVMNIVKAIVRYPRPFTVIEGLTGKELEGATGYSFPSGHSTNAASLYSSVAVNFRKKGLSFICAAMIVLVGLSRLYLGVHWPTDVLCGIILGICMTFGLNEFLTRLMSDTEKAVRIGWFVGGFLFAAGLFFGILVDFAGADRTAFRDLVTVLAMFGGALLGFGLEEKTLPFSVEGNVRAKFFRYIIGLITLILLRAGLKAILPTAVTSDGFRYGILGFWIYGGYPVLGVKVKLFQAEKKQAEQAQAE